MFRFANPELLYLLTAIPVMIILFVVGIYSRRRRLARFGQSATVKLLTPEVSAWRIRLKFVLFALAYTSLVVAMARPQFGSKLRKQTSRGIEMMLVVDVSRSMLAEDFTPSRLERTKYAINRLFDGLKNERTGVVVFAGEAAVELPITSDYTMARAFADRISPNMVAVQGTSIGKALELSSMSFSSGSDSSRAIILITDGENHDQLTDEAIEMAKKRGIKIFTIGIGTPEGAPIEINGEYVRDENGEIVVSHLDEELLKHLAVETGGAYLRATNQTFGLEEILGAINDMEKKELASLRFEEYNEQYQYFVAIALFLLLIEFALLDRRNPRLRGLNIFS